MKKFLFCSVFIVLFASHANAWYYDYFTRRQLLTKVAAVDHDLCSKYAEMIHSIYKSDQDCRKSVSFKQCIDITDSLNFERYAAFATQNGIIQLNKQNFPDSVERVTLKQELYIFNLHTSNPYLFQLMPLFEQSIKMRTCDESDLVDYFVTYLSRSTEFSKNYSMVALPDFYAIPMGKYYLAAMVDFLNFLCKQTNQFQFFVCANYLTYPQNFWEKTMKINKDIQQNGGRMWLLSLSAIDNVRVHMNRTYKPKDIYKSVGYILICNDHKMLLPGYQMEQ